MAGTPTALPALAAQQRGVPQQKHGCAQHVKKSNPLLLSMRKRSKKQRKEEINEFVCLALVSATLPKTLRVIDVANAATGA